MKPTLTEFLTRVNKCPSSMYVKEKGFKTLYVRDTKRYINGEMVKCLDIANVETVKKGKGTFTNLILRLHIEMNICVECVTSTRFESLLVRLGFIILPQNPDYGFPSYYLSRHKGD